MVDADIVAAAAAVVDAAACFPCCPSQKKGVKVKGASSRAGKGKGRARQRLSEHKVREHDAPRSLDLHSGSPTCSTPGSEFERRWPKC